MVWWHTAAYLGQCHSFNNGTSFWSKLYWKQCVLTQALNCDIIYSLKYDYQLSVAEGSILVSPEGIGGFDMPLYTLNLYIPSIPFISSIFAVQEKSHATTTLKLHLYGLNNHCALNYSTPFTYCIIWLNPFIQVGRSKNSLKYLVLQFKKGYAFQSIQYLEKVWKSKMKKSFSIWKYCILLLCAKTYKKFKAARKVLGFHHHLNSGKHWYYKAFCEDHHWLVIKLSLLLFLNDL